MHPLAHMLTGALVGQLAPSPVVAVVGGLLSHLALDAIPHAEGGTFSHVDGSRLRLAAGAPNPHHAGGGLRRPLEMIEAGLELVAGIVALAWLDSRCPGLDLRLVCLGVFGGLIPDLIDQPVERLWGVNVVHPERIHWTVGRRFWLLGILTQVVVAAAAILFLWRAGGCG